MTSDGEVAVRQNGQEHAVAAPRLEDQIHVDLDHPETPRMRVPSGVSVEYRDDESDDNLETDGGHVDRTEVEMRGAGIDEELAGWGLIASGLLLVSAGYLLSLDAGVAGLAGIIGGFAGIILGYITGQAYWSDRT